MWLSESQPLNWNRIWHACTQLQKCELPHRLFDLNVTCHQEKAPSNISRAIIKCYKQLGFIHWHSLSSPFHFNRPVTAIRWMGGRIRAAGAEPARCPAAAPAKGLNGPRCLQHRPPTPAHSSGLANNPNELNKITSEYFLARSLTCLNPPTCPSRRCSGHSQLKHKCMGKALELRAFGGNTNFKQFCRFTKPKHSLGLNLLQLQIYFFVKELPNTFNDHTHPSVSEHAPKHLLAVDMSSCLSTLLFS